MEDDIRILEASHARIDERRAFVRALISSIVGPENADIVLTEAEYLPLLRSVMRSDGKDKVAVQRLKEAFHPRFRVKRFRLSVNVQPSSLTEEVASVEAIMRLSPSLSGHLPRSDRKTARQTFGASGMGIVRGPASPAERVRTGRRAISV